MDAKEFLTRVEILPTEEPEDLVIVDPPASTEPARQYPDVNTYGENKRLRYLENSHAGLTDLFITALRREYQHQKEQPEKTSVREKLQSPAKPTSPKISARSRNPEL